ncbi:MtrAB system histidine kinase MtrB [Kocuria sp. p3-SID1433]|uniref:MtrAB system histidine kinase MtrB n=1 Tax=unclassified Kocuria TaxID=2649579 RepID=UPI0021A47FF3|nr:MULTISPECIES: MtrAB system histidine kinase MtrB [unclassified Kocuria]MCT1601510.1 MtrAB system histidine kinase MtrB [Kocuria sp. p3-SID1428]MCT2180100.1 MtrAB system histidine kinase MtrB [Kocuria sp. p3-SID1433]
MTDLSSPAGSRGSSAGAEARPGEDPAGPTLPVGIVDAPEQAPIAQAEPGSRGRRRRYRGLIGGARLRLRLVLRRWRHSLQFRAVSIALIGVLVVFLVTGSFLSHQISERLFTDALGQALSQSEADYRSVQASFDASEGGDQAQLQTLVSSTLSGLNSGSDRERSRWVLLPLLSDGETSDDALPPQAETSWMGEQTIPEELQEEVSDSAGVDESMYWQSSSAQIDEGGLQVPVVIVGQVVEPRQGSPYGLYFVHDFEQPQRTLDAMHAVLLLATLVQALLVSGVVWYVTREIVRPVTNTARSSESLADGNLDARMQVHGSHEVARLGRSFNRMADNLADQITRLEQLSSMQQTFVSDVSHELRTPLTTVRMAAEVLHNARDEFDPVNRRSAELLYHQVDRFDVLLADLLEISRFDAGAARLEITGVNIIQQITGVLETTAPLAANADTVIRLHTDRQRILVQMDQRRIERILRNLVVNAIEHGEGRPIDIVVRASDNAVAVAVRDHGIGLTEEQTAKVFDRFWRADPARARTTGGTGLGLSISAEDTRLHGGWLDAWGSPGEGACFRLSLPLLQSRPLSEDDVPPVDLPPDPEATPVVGVVTDTGTMVAIPLDQDSVVSRSTGQLQLSQIRRASEDAETPDGEDQASPESSQASEQDGTAGAGPAPSATAHEAIDGTLVGASAAGRSEGGPRYTPVTTEAAGLDPSADPADKPSDGPDLRRVALEGADSASEPHGPVGGTAFRDAEAGQPPSAFVEEDDLDESYEDLFPDDTGELPAFRDLPDPELGDTEGAGAAEPHSDHDDDGRSS